MAYAKRIEPATIRGQSTANNAFIGAELKLDEAIAALQAARQNHLWMASYGSKNWTEAETAVSMANEVVRAVNRINGHPEG